MTVTLSLALVFGVLVAGLLRFRAVGLGAAAACGLFGFYLADTGAATTINQTVDALAGALSGLG
ncbi:hypothetical protein RM780_09480 [Streptomyces sp. DSM 44917]|uniref:Uncharacterized protein n=1 Tax=Streptomyces boetiae TaxID=3075541 RepID=A0ABU2L789_9ACTN|nr:hypothetical protein [Streptomyces sp. DSM 44917]MDT0307192.1 hypothetical protein [Streptomyces sp. DSM 44917]